MSLSEVRQAERGRADLSVLGALSTAMGGSLDALLAGEQFWAAPGLALKTASPQVEVAVARHSLARAAAAAQDADGLVRRLALPDAWAERGAPLGPAGIQGEPALQAEKLARKARDQAGYGDEPIASIRSAMARLGVATFLAEFASDDIDAAMWRVRGRPPAACVNTQARRGLVTAIRFSFAHELCHALFDRPKDAEAGILERRAPFATAQEQRANAFAAYFIAPRRGIAQFLRDSGVDKAKRPSAQNLLQLSLHYGLGVEAMAAHLVHLRYWRERDLEEHRGLRSPHFACSDDRELHPTHGEQLVPMERRGLVLDLATQALERSVISVGRWREMLGLGFLTDWRLILQERHVVTLDAEHRLGLH